MTVIIAWFLADILTGIVHWAEDRLLRFQTNIKFLEGIKYDNDLHHADPRALTAYSYWQNMNTTAPFAWSIAGIAFVLGLPSVIVWMFFFAGFANLIHRLAHEPPDQLPKIIRLLQKTGIFISDNHHRKHHYSGDKLIKKEDTTGYYCAMTNWMNPILDSLGFFKALEWLSKIVLTEN